jgi:hypothetical protein
MAVDVQGFVRFNITVNLSGDEIKDWSPERIRAWFDGVAQVVEAAGESVTIEIVQDPSAASGGGA